MLTNAFSNLAKGLLATLPHGIGFADDGIVMPLQCGTQVRLTGFHFAFTLVIDISSLVGRSRALFRSRSWLVIQGMVLMDIDSRLLSILAT